jgi:hypothetical protein
MIRIEGAEIFFWLHPLHRFPIISEVKKTNMFDIWMNGRGQLKSQLVSLYLLKTSN